MFEGLIEFFTNGNIIMYISAYLVGSIPFGLILAKKYANVDVQKDGSKSIGATNVLRVVKKTNPALAKKLGIATILLDGIKGALMIGIAFALGFSLETLWAVAVFAVIGHCYSAYLKLEGGKGVATALGVLLVLNPIPTLIGAVVWVVSAKLLKISSLSSLFGLGGVVVATVFLNDGMGIGSNAPLYIIAFLIVYKHIPNIMRVFSGEEKKVV